jgi:hypothetical protein
MSSASVVIFPSSRAATLQMADSSRSSTICASSSSATPGRHEATELRLLDDADDGPDPPRIVLEDRDFDQLAGELRERFDLKHPRQHREAGKVVGEEVLAGGHAFETAGFFTRHELDDSIQEDPTHGAEP